MGICRAADVEPALRLENQLLRPLLGGRHSKQRVPISPLDIVGQVRPVGVRKDDAARQARLRGPVEALAIRRIQQHILRRLPAGAFDDVLPFPWRGEGPGERGGCVRGAVPCVLARRPERRQRDIALTVIQEVCDDFLADYDLTRSVRHRSFSSAFLETRPQHQDA